jgi:hypothetical protein
LGLGPEEAFKGVDIWVWELTLDLRIGQDLVEMEEKVHIEKGLLREQSLGNEAFVLKVSFTIKVLSFYIA